MSLRLVASQISKNYSGRPVLRDCSFSFETGTTYVLTGPNGSGKSTFLRICALLEQQDGGEVRYFSGDQEMPRDITLRRRVTLVLPGVGVFNTTVFKNVSFGLTVRGYKGHELEERVMNALAFVGLDTKRNQRARTLSSGETKRLGIARALAIEPEILFLDEPTTSVDQENTEIIEGIITKLKQQHGRTIIITTHDAGQAERLADRRLVMKNGKIGEHAKK